MKFVDQLKQSIEIRSTPERIISLVPSQTELLFDLGLDDRVVGITKFCIHPPVWRDQKTLIGGTKNFNLDVIRSLQPDLIIANKEENDAGRIAALQKDFPVWISDVSSRKSALEMITSIGQLTDTVAQAATITMDIENAFQSIKKVNVKRSLYLIWQKPWMAAGSDTFIHAMMEEMGLHNVISETRYPEVTDEQINALNPELVLLSSEPFPFQQKHQAELAQRLPNARIELVDGEMFSWYGSRMRWAPAYFNSLKL